MNETVGANAERLYVDVFHFSNKDLCLLTDILRDNFTFCTTMAQQVLDFFNSGINRVQKNMMRIKRVDTLTFI